MRADYHIHTPHCGHAKGATVEYVESAIARGCTEMAFTDHLGRYYLTKSQQKRYWDWGMDERELARYYEEVSDLKSAYAGRIAIRIGLEVDFVQGAEDLLAPVLNHYAFDLLLGSIHCSPRIGWHHLVKYTDRDPELVYREYFVNAHAAAESGLFQSLAHLDFIWRYVPWPAGLTGWVLENVESVVRRAAANDVCVEINMNAYLWSLSNKMGDYDPLSAMLDAVRESGARITIGSDAHVPAAVGEGFDALTAYIKSKGVCQTTLFAARKATFVPLD